MRIVDFRAVPLDQSMWIRIGADHALPSRFDVVARLGDPPCDVSLDVRVDKRTASPVIHELRVKRIDDSYPFGPGVTASRLHQIALDGLLQRAIQKVRQPIVPLPDRDGWTGLFQLRRDADADSDVAYGGLPIGELRGRGKRTPDEYLRRVANIYRSAIAEGNPPTKAVEKALHVSRSHAGRLVGQARDAGHLGRTTPGKAGENV